MTPTIVAGLFIRRQIRRALLTFGVLFTEERGWLDSYFYLHSEMPTDLAAWMQKAEATLMAKRLQ